MSRLQTAIENTPDVQGNGKIGKTAIKNEYRSKIIVPIPRKLTYSLDIDEAVKNLYPEDSRWDYALEYDDEVYFLEFHPADTSQINIVLAKLSWLKQWLLSNAPKINELKSLKNYPFYWVATQSIHISPTSSQYRRLATNKLLPQKVWNFSKI